MLFTLRGQAILHDSSSLLATLDRINQNFASLTAALFEDLAAVASRTADFQRWRESTKKGSPFLRLTDGGHT